MAKKPQGSRDVNREAFDEMVKFFATERAKGGAGEAGGESAGGGEDWGGGVATGTKDVESELIPAIFKLSTSQDNVYPHIDLVNLIAVLYLAEQKLGTPFMNRPWAVPRQAKKRTLLTQASSRGSLAV